MLMWEKKMMKNEKDLDRLMLLVNGMLISAYRMGGYATVGDNKAMRFYREKSNKYYKEYQEILKKFGVRYFG